MNSNKKARLSPKEEIDHLVVWYKKHKPELKVLHTGLSQGHRAKALSREREVSREERTLGQRPQYPDRQSYEDFTLLASGVRA